MTRNTRLTKLIKIIKSSILIRNLAASLMGGILLRLAPVIFMPITIYLLDPEDYGLLALSHSFIGICSIVSTLGLRQVFSIEFFHRTKDGQKTLLNDLMLIYIVCFAVAAILILPTLNWINSFAFCGYATYALIFVCIMCCFMCFFTELFYQVLSLHLKTPAMVTGQLISTFTTATLNVIVLFFLKMGVLGMMIAYLIGMNISCCCAIYLYVKKSYISFFDPSGTYRRTMYYLKMAIPILPSLLVNWALSASDIWILAKYTSIYSTGIYAIANNFGQLHQLATLTPLQQAYLPFLLKKYSDNRSDTASVEKWNRRNMLWTAIVSTVVVSIFAFAGAPILRWILPVNRKPAVGYIWLILFNNTIWLCSSFMGTLIGFLKKVNAYTPLLAIPTCLNIGLNFLMTPRLGIWGCLLATTISYGVHFLATMAYTNYILKQHIRGKIKIITPAELVVETQKTQSKEIEQQL